ncbi:MAG: hypothetical protein ACR2HF_16030 [Methylococcaceae bacterium]
MRRGLLIETEGDDISKAYVLFMGDLHTRWGKQILKDAAQHGIGGMKFGRVEGHDMMEPDSNHDKPHDQASLDSERKILMDLGQHIYLNRHRLTIKRAQGLRRQKNRDSLLEIDEEYGD